MKLLEPIDLHDRVICADSWFTSLHLIKSIKDRAGHFVGTIAEKPYLPSKFVAKQGLQEGESLTVFNHEAKVSLTYKKTHKTKSVRVISDIHKSGLTRCVHQPQHLGRLHDGPSACSMGSSTL